ncbi:MAG: ATP-binding cassette domain-containing protein [Actinobacteria bacterium]|nr:MAG: ATP-binding cassette domain-containing protein [Actinomycetota bacterium]
MGATAVVVAAELARPFPLKLVVDRLLLEHGGRKFAVPRGDWPMLAAVAALAISIALLGALASSFAAERLRRTGDLVVRDLRAAIYAHLQRLTLAFRERRQTTDVAARVTGDVSAVGAVFRDALRPLATSVLLLAGMLVVSIYLDPILGIVAFAVTPLLAWLTSRAHHERSTSTGSQLDLTGAMTTAVVLVLGVFRVAAGALTPGDLIVVHAYARRLYPRMRAVGHERARLTRATAGGDRIAGVLAADDELAEVPGAYHGPRAKGVLDLDNVGFAYDADTLALSNVTLHVPAGQHVSIVGRSGAGKSTLAALLARFHDPTAGGVLIDGRDVRNCARDWVRAQVGLVLPDTVMFAGTVADNIAYGTDATRAQIEGAATSAGAHTFVAQLPDGYDTVLGPGGAGLSAGQRQRIAIARTLLRDPPIVLLDEPTAGLDPESESEVLAGLDALVPGRTVVLFTHSIDLARVAERVVVMVKGEVVDDGQPGEVLDRPVPFAPLGARAARAPAPSRRAPAPSDPELPRLAELLDPEVMADVLARSLDASAPAPLVRTHYVRYQPGKNLVVHYDVDLDGHSHGAVAMIARGDELSRWVLEPRNRAMAVQVNGRSPAAMPLAFEREVDALIQWLPLDLSLPPLAQRPTELRRHLRAAGLDLSTSGWEGEFLNYRPGRRAVLKVDDYVIKVYAQEPRFEQAAGGLYAARQWAVRTPRLLASLDDQHVTAQRFLEGDTPSDPAEMAGEAGEVLASLHRAAPDGLVPRTPADHLAAAAEAAQLVSHISPELTGRLERLLSELEASAPDAGAPVTSHGDFHARQFLHCADGLVLIDLDRVCAAPAALDPSSFAAHLVNEGRPDLDAARVALERLLGGYGGRPPGMSWYLATAILRRAPNPFRTLHEQWPDRVASIVDAAADALAR